MLNVRQPLRLTAITLGLIPIYALAIAAAPLALVVLVVAWIIRKFQLDDEDKIASSASMIWLLAIGVSGMVINVLCLPLGLLWRRLHGQPMPHPIVRLRQNVSSLSAQMEITLAAVSRPPLADHAAPNPPAANGL